MVRPARSNQGGFTLVELILVIIIVGTLSTMAARPLSNILSYKAEIQIHELALAMDYAQMFALQTGCIVAAEFLSGQVILKMLEQRCYREEPDVIHPGTLEPYRVETPVDVQLNHTHLGKRDSKQIVFYPSGQACNLRGRGSVKIEVVVDATDQRYLNVDCATAHIEYSRGP